MSLLKKVLSLMQGGFSILDSVFRTNMVAGKTTYAIGTPYRFVSAHLYITNLASFLTFAATYTAFRRVPLGRENSPLLE